MANPSETGPRGPAGPLPDPLKSTTVSPSAPPTAASLPTWARAQPPDRPACARRA